MSSNKRWPTALTTISCDTGAHRPPACALINARHSASASDELTSPLTEPDGVAALAPKNRCHGHARLRHGGRRILAKETALHAPAAGRSTAAPLLAPRTDHLSDYLRRPN
ncbi:unnamed protein product [Chrysodeixis includens]|uniref:Uncharacterized protein n=1 Tax=Chrysodeixis includens TaxID=689277 RepID=A0A9N8KPH8_CHRIL|nr:unnamed protein product [Chrysodeixis includens]